LAPSTITKSQLFTSACIYLAGALLEELAFRGHALIRLRECYGTIIAVLLVSLAFGALHLPGMFGGNAIKIVVLTGCSSLLFCLAYLFSGSLWAAVGLHAGMNFALHSLLGAGGGKGPSLLTPVYKAAAPAGNDAAFWCFVVVQLACAAGFLLARKRLPSIGRERTR
jgi:membrane protease YdiL (CAAX protease family)